MDLHHDPQLSTNNVHNDNYLQELQSQLQAKSPPQNTATPMMPFLPYLQNPYSQAAGVPTSWNMVQSLNLGHVMQSGGSAELAPQKENLVEPPVSTNLDTPLNLSKPKMAKQLLANNNNSSNHSGTNDSNNNTNKSKNVNCKVNGDRGMYYGVPPPLMQPMKASSPVQSVQASAQFKMAGTEDNDFLAACRLWPAAVAAAASAGINESSHHPHHQHHGHLQPKMAEVVNSVSNKSDEKVRLVRNHRSHSRNSAPDREERGERQERGGSADLLAMHHESGKPHIKRPMNAVGILVKY